MEFNKDPKVPCGWSTKTYEQGGTVDGMNAVHAGESSSNVLQVWMPAAAYRRSERMYDSIT